MSRAVIFANGHLPDLKLAHAILCPDDTIIAADGGANQLYKMDVLPDIIIGDLDSVEENALRKYKSAGITIEQYPVDKDETDLELALRHALEMGPKSIVIVGALGGRLDQTLANLALLTDERLSGLDVRLDDGVESAFFCGKQAKVQGRSGDVVSLMPWGGVVTGVVTEGLQWTLSDETLYPEKSRGVSNIMLGDSASIKIESGLLLVIHTRKA